MRRPERPWFRSFDGWWMVCLNGKQIKLAKGKENEKEAWNAFYKLMASGDPAAIRPQGTIAASILDLFLEHSAKHNSARTYEWYRDYLQDFANSFGTVPIADLKPFHVSRWLDGHDGWHDASRRGAISALKRAFNWAVDEGLLEKNPIKGVKKPRMPRRERLLTPEEQQQLIDGATDDCFREFLIALRESGARPGEVSSVTAEMVDLKDETWTLWKHKTKAKTQKPRIIYLTQILAEVSQKLVEKYPSGPLFRNSEGKPWNRNSIRCRLRRMRKRLKLGNDVVAYLFRHGFATDALVNGVSLAAVAELMGHSDLKMVAEHYGHLAERRSHLREMAKQARAQGA